MNKWHPGEPEEDQSERIGDVLNGKPYDIDRNLDMEIYLNFSGDFYPVEIVRLKPLGYAVFYRKIPEKIDLVFLQSDAPVYVLRRTSAYMASSSVMPDATLRGGYLLRRLVDLFGFLRGS